MSLPTRQKSGRYATASALLLATGLALATTAGAGLTAAGSGALQDTLRFVGIGRDSALEQEQQSQARTIAELQQAVSAMRGDFVKLNSRVESGDPALQQQVGRLAADVGTLKSEIGDLRSDEGDDATSELLHQQAEGLGAAVKQTRLDMGALRASFDGREEAQRKALAVINRRLSRLESTLASAEVTGSIRARRRHHRFIRRALSTPPTPKI